MVHFDRSGHFRRSDRNGPSNLIKLLSPVPLFCILLTRPITIMQTRGGLGQVCATGRGSSEISNQNFLSLVVSCLHILLPVFTRIINCSLTSGEFPDCWKEALVSPLLKKSGVLSEFTNLRPVSNLQYVSKLTELAVFDQTHAHVTPHGLYPPFQSAYRKCHSTETALLKVQNDILMNFDSQRVTLLVLLDLSAAFDTVDHGMLLNRFSTSFGVMGSALQWFTSYLLNRSQRVSFDQNLSEKFNLQCGVSQGLGMPRSIAVHHLCE